MLIEVDEMTIDDMLNYNVDNYPDCKKVDEYKQVHQKAKAWANFLSSADQNRIQMSLDWLQNGIDKVNKIKEDWENDNSKLMEEYAKQFQTYIYCDIFSGLCNKFLNDAKYLEQCATNNGCRLKMREMFENYCSAVTISLVKIKDLYSQLFNQIANFKEWEQILKEKQTKLRKYSDTCVNN